MLKITLMDYLNHRISKVFNIYLTYRLVLVDELLGMSILHSKHDYIYIKAAAVVTTKGLKWTFLKIPKQMIISVVSPSFENVDHCIV